MMVLRGICGGMESGDGTRDSWPYIRAPEQHNTRDKKKKKKRKERNLLRRVNIVIKPVVMVMVMIYQLLQLGSELSPGNRI